MSNLGENIGEVYRGWFGIEVPLVKIVSQVVSDNPKQLSDYQSGKDKLFGFFVSEVMRRTGGKANPDQVNEFLKKELLQNVELHQADNKQPDRPTDTTLTLLDVVLREHKRDKNSPAIPMLLEIVRTRLKGE